MPRTRLVARHEIAHARNIRKRWRAHCGRDRQRAQFPAPRCRNLRRGSFIASSQEVPVVASHAKGGGDGTGLTRLCCTAFVRSWPIAEPRCTATWRLLSGVLRPRFFFRALRFIAHLPVVGGRYFHFPSGVGLLVCCAAR